MTRKILQLILLLALVIFPRARVDACTATPLPYPTATYTPTSTATDVPPGVTPAPSLTPTASYTPVPRLQAEARKFYEQAPVVFRGRIVQAENAYGFDEILTVAVREYYKGSGAALVHIADLFLFRQCNSAFAARPGREMVFYVIPAGADGLQFYPVAIFGEAPDNAEGYAPAVIIADVRLVGGHCAGAFRDGGCAVPHVDGQATTIAAGAIGFGHGSVLHDVGLGRLEYDMKLACSYGNHCRNMIREGFRSAQTLPLYLRKYGMLNKHHTRQARDK